MEKLFVEKEVEETKNEIMKLANRLFEYGKEMAKFDDSHDVTELRRKVERLTEERNTARSFMERYKKQAEDALNKVDKLKKKVPSKNKKYKTCRLEFDGESFGCGLPMGLPGISHNKCRAKLKEHRNRKDQLEKLRKEQI